MANEPITREEIMLNAIATGEATNLKPITREEMFLAKLGGVDVNTPTPITRKEQFLQKAIEGGGSGGGSTPGGGGGGTGGGGDNFPIGDGNTHIWVSFGEGRTSPMLGVCPDGTVTVDWGDGTEPDVLTGTRTDTVKWTPTHNYAKEGDYIITLTVDGKMGLTGTSGTGNGANILRLAADKHNSNQGYACSLRRVELGTGIILGQYAFAFCRSLTHIVMPNGVATLPQGVFHSCGSMRNISIPDGVTKIEVNAFYSCDTLTVFYFPASLNRIDRMAFAYSYGIRYYDFTNHTAIPTLGSADAFNTGSTDFEIRVPAALYDEWTAATNWTTYASQIVAV